MERMLANRLIWWLELYQKLPNSQYGFRRRRSCIDNLFILHTAISNDSKNKKAIPAVFLDIQSAFDNVLPNILLEKLFILKFPPNCCNFIYNLITHRRITCRQSSIDGTFIAHRGLPQGSVLSPILYTLYVSKLEQDCNLNTNIIQYADDVCIYSNLNATQGGLKEIEKTMTKINHTLDNLGLSLSTNKTQLCIFNNQINKNKINHNTNLNFKGTIIPPSSKIKFLGITFHSSLNWFEHFSSLEFKCLNTLKTLKCLGHKWWGSDPSLLLRLYRSLIRSKLEYGGFLFHDISLALKSKLDKILMRAIRIVMGYRNSTPLNVILTEAHEPSLFYRIKYLGLNFFSRISTSQLHPMRPLLGSETFGFKNRTSVLKDISLTFNPYKNILPSKVTPLGSPNNFFAYFYTLCVDLTTGKDLANYHNANDKFNIIFNKELSNTKCLFTDGSVIPDVPYSDFAVVSLDSNTVKRFQTVGSMSSFYVEAMAIWEALLLIRDHKWQFSTIFSDSMASLTAILNKTKPSQNTHIILDIKNLLFQLREENFNIKLVWIPSHKGIKGNELADDYAKDAVRCGIPSSAKITYNDIKNKWKKIILNESSDWCKNEAQFKGSFYFK